jgi:hypothetical protein
MPKITVHGGPSIAEPEGVEQPSPGTSSSISEEKPTTADEPKTPPLPSPVPTTVSRSGRGRKGNSSASSTAG